MRADSGADFSRVARRFASNRSTATSQSETAHSARVGDLPLEASEELLDLRSRFQPELIESLQDLSRQVEPQEKLVDGGSVTWGFISSLRRLGHAVIASTTKAPNGTRPYSMASRSRRSPRSSVVWIVATAQWNTAKGTAPPVQPWVGHHSKGATAAATAAPGRIARINFLRLSTGERSNAST